jgi:mRNA-degrading endonuclease HigB of HigAB toxin-antitoxin module
MGERVVVPCTYEYKQMLIKFVGTHAEYDRIDAEALIGRLDAA